MKILQVNNHFHLRGGSDTVFFNEIDLLSGAGHEVVPFASASHKNRPSAYDRFFPDSVETRRPRARDTLRFFRNRDAARQLEALIREEGPFDVAHLHIYYGKLTPSILPVLAAAGIPVVQSLHDYKLACPVYTLQRDGRLCDLCVEGSSLNVLRHRCKDGSLVRSAVMFTEHHLSRIQGDVRLVDRLICVSAFQHSVFRRAGLPADKLTVLHNSVDTAGIRPFSGNRKAEHLVYIGRIEESKGLPTLLDAVEATGDRLIVAGTGGWEEALRRRAAANPAVDYRGFVSGENLWALLRDARAVVVPSVVFDICPMSVLEAKAAGTAVVGADIGGIPELIEDGVDGVLFEPGSTTGLVAALRRLEGLGVEALGTAAREDVERRFSHAAHLERLEDIYRSVMRGQ